MAGCIENLPACVWFEGGDRRNALASILAGLLFFTGWWLMIDAAGKYPDSFNGAYHICGIIGTLSLLMINAVSNAQVRGDSYSGGCMGPRGARAWLFIGFVLGFAAVIASCWILFADFANSKREARMMVQAVSNGFERAKKCEVLDRVRERLAHEAFPSRVSP